MHKERVWWRPPGSNSVYSIEASASGTSCFRFEPFSCSESASQTIELRGHAVKSDFPQPGTIAITSPFKDISTSQDQHSSAVKHALELIKSGELEKVVVSRVKSIEHQAAPETAFKSKCKAHPDAFVYLIEHPTCGVWCGATPELLVSVSDNRLETVSLAGTRTLDQIATSPWTSKEYAEQELVTDYIKDILENQGATDLRIEPRDNLNYGNLVHLETRFHGTIKGDIDQLAKNLHPTPAVGGRPLEKACSFISEHEGYDRQYFTGYLGVETASGGAYYVNLRCAKWLKGGINLYAGGGIVEGSDIVEEWKETEAKICAILDSIE